MTMLTRLSYKTRFEKHILAINAFLEDVLKPREPYMLWQAMRHGVLNGGKRIRPVILVETCLASGGKIENTLPTASALELIHCYSLIHDDLPCMDNDDLRRGLPTVHKAFSENMAVLAGDALLAMAFGLITDKTEGVSPQIILKVLSKLSAVSGVKGLVNGQVDDLVFMNSEPDESVLYRIHKGKTGALFGFSAWAGAMLADKPQYVCNILEEYGETLGIAFQIVDDLLDIDSNSEVLGKTVGKDQQQGKITFPSVYGIQKSKQILKEYINKLHHFIDLLSDEIRTANLRFLIKFVHERES